MSTNDWNVPDTAVFDRIRTVLDDDGDAVLATVVAVEGSAYRRPGARMLVRPDGGGAGSITAGCLEDEVRALAADVLAAGEPRVETWDLTGDDDVWGLGLGCNGVITVLLEVLDESYRPVVDALAAGEDIGVATVVGGDGDLAVGERVYYRPSEGFDDALPGWVRDGLAEPMETHLDGGTGATVTVEGDSGAVDGDQGAVEVFVEGVTAPPHLVVFGTGHDVDPVVELARLVDLRVTVVGFRGARATPERFPQADAVVATSPRDVRETVAFDDDTYAVVMSHNFVDDRMTLGELLETPVPYVGLMGPRKRFREMLDRFAEEGRTLTESERDRIYTPIGLDLGGDGPYGIAYTIVGEVLAVANDRTPTHLADRDGPIHDRAESTTD